ncbi:hypothetical protein ACFVXC_16110 [Streptomyces sp. NPDC058257]|uniref:hypothetical protein n=1 Tax=Streptomyces sp. NPDC058257 TaxID=3346409 RepID=UPI0036E649EA
MTEQDGGLAEPDEPGVPVLRDRILLHTRTVAAAEAVDDVIGGTVLCSTQAVERAKDAGRNLQGPLLLDPGRYEKHVAGSADSFYVKPRDDDGPMLYAPRRDAGYPGREQLDAGATAVLTPTRYFTIGDIHAVTAATRRVRELDPEKVIFTVPLAAPWLRSDQTIRWLIDSLNLVPHVKAIALGSPSDPLPDLPTAQRLRDLIDGIHNVALIRTGLAGLDAYARGAAFVSIGVQNSCRAFWPPDAGHPEANPRGTPKPYVLHPVLMEYFPGGDLAHLYGHGRPPECPCGVCHGQPYTRFVGDDPDDVEEAEQHNLATWLPWAEELQRASPGGARRDLWQRRCYRAVDAREAIERRWRSRRSPPQSAALTLWATERD